MDGWAVPTPHRLLPPVSPTAFADATRHTVPRPPALALPSHAGGGKGSFDRGGFGKGKGGGFGKGDRDDRGGGSWGSGGKCARLPELWDFF